MLASLLAPAKLNLYLHVTGKRGDGYHLIESLVAFAEYGDVIAIHPASILSMEIEGPFAVDLATDDSNLVIKAAKALQAYAPGKGAHIVLTKNLPVGAGLGGGSADAAAALKALASYWDIKLTETQLQEIIRALGSDVPACYAAKPAWLTGIGEIITPVDMKVKLWAVLCNPRIPLLTTDIYRRFNGSFASAGHQPVTIASAQALKDYLAPTKNMLEPAAFASAPVLQEIIAAITATSACMLARMSGSGSTCFGLYVDQRAAQGAAGMLQKRYPDYWLMVTALQTSGQ